MATLVMDPQIEERLLEDRRAWGGDRFDEVWDGVYVRSPLANNEHMELMSGLCATVTAACAAQVGTRVFPGVNVSDRKKGWEKNYRCPDLAVVLPGSTAVDYESFFQGGPDFCAEIISDHDRSREKFDFYARVGVRELLLVDRNPWQLELYRLSGGELKLVGTANLANQQLLVSEVLSISFALQDAAPKRPQIIVVKPETGQRWMV